MIGKYGFSLNGEHYVGAFATRDAATAAAFASARSEASPPATVYVGRMIAADTKASGHARAIRSHMAARAREEAGSAGGGYLATVSKAQLEELDAALENTVLGWLTKNGLLPTYFRVEAISEVPVPSPLKSAGIGSADEVHDLGVSDAMEVSL